MEAFINQKNLRGFWPYLPSGTLVKRSRAPLDTASIVDKQWKEFDSAVNFIDNLVQARTLYIIWILAAIIGIIGNLVVSVLLTEPKFSNFRIFFKCSRFFNTYNYNYYWIILYPT